MRMNAVLSNPKHPEYGQFTVPLPIPHNQYDGIMEALNAMDMGDPLARDCQMDEILGEYPILKRLEGKPVNIDELDYLAKRLDSFCYAQEGAQFQGAAVSYDYSDMTDLINLTFSCQQVTVITDFSDLEQVGRDHYMVLNGGCASNGWPNRQSLWVGSPTPVVKNRPSQMPRNTWTPFGRNFHIKPPQASAMKR